MTGALRHSAPRQRRCAGRRHRRWIARSAHTICPGRRCLPVRVVGEMLAECKDHTVCLKPCLSDRAGAGLSECFLLKHEKRLEQEHST